MQVGADHGDRQGGGGEGAPAGPQPRLLQMALEQVQDLAGRGAGRDGDISASDVLSTVREASWTRSCVGASCQFLPGA